MPISTIQGHLYDYPQYYDLIFATDWKAEFRFIEQCIERHAQRRVRRIFEPACGTGRLLVRFARAGYEVSGNDLSRSAVAYCNRRLKRAGFAASACVGDMADFRLPRRVDLAFNMINSIRHLPDEAAADAHLACLAEAIAPGGLYVLGLHLTPGDGRPGETEVWQGRRGTTSVRSKLWSRGIDLRRRQELVGMTFDIRTATERFRLTEDMVFRTYTARQMNALLQRAPQFDVVETYNFDYDIDAPAPVTRESEDTVYVLRRR